MHGFTRPQPSRFTRRNFLIGTGVTAAGLAFYSGEIARHELDIVERPIAINNLPSSFHGYRIVQLSDIHLDEYTEPFFLERIVHRVNALAPGIINTRLSAFVINDPERDFTGNMNPKAGKPGGTSPLGLPDHGGQTKPITLSYFGAGDMDPSAGPSSSAKREPARAWS